MIAVNMVGLVGTISASAGWDWGTLVGSGTLGGGPGGGFVARFKI